MSIYLKGKFGDELYSKTKTVRGKMVSQAWHVFLHFKETGIANFESTSWHNNGAKVDDRNFCDKLSATVFNASKFYLRNANPVRDKEFLLKVGEKAMEEGGYCYAVSYPIKTCTSPACI
jgi:hypothetical protein